MATIKLLVLGVFLLGISLNSFAQSDRVYINVYNSGAKKEREIVVIQNGQIIKSLDISILKDEFSVSLANILDTYFTKGYKIESTSNSHHNADPFIFFILKKED